MLNFDGKTNDADEVHRIAELLLPRNLCRSRVRHRNLNAAAVMVSAVLHRAFETETASREG